MKILHLIDSGGFYGAEAVLLELVKEQRKQGIDAQICSIGTLSDKEKAIEKMCRMENLPVHAFRMRAGPNILGALKILSFAKKEKVDIFHSHGYKANILFALLPAFIRKIPLLVTLHGWTSVKPWKKIWFYEKLDAFLLRYRPIVVLVSSAMTEKLAALCRKNKCIVIENGISTQLPEIRGKDIAKKLLQIKSSGKKIIGSIGRLSHEKGYDTLIQAFSLCDSTMMLVIMGDGPRRQELEQLVETKKLGNRVLFLGYTEQASQYLSFFDVYVNSSRTEGTPITLLEAMRARVIIVARDVGGNRQVLGNGQYGYLVKDENPETMSEEILKSLTSSSQQVEQAYQSFLQCYSVTVMSDKYSHIYQGLVNIDE